MPPFSIALFLEVFAGHGGSMLAAHRAISPISGWFDHRFDAPFTPAHLVDPIRIVARIGVEPLWQAVQRHIKAFAQKILGLTLVVGRSPSEQALDLMKSLRDELQETVLLGARHDVEGFVLEQVASLKPVKFLVDPGTRFPLHTSAAGKAILSALPTTELESILSRLKYKKFTDRTLDSRRKLERELEKTIAVGYAVDIREEIEGLHCVGAPIFNHHGYPVAALWVTGPSFRFPEKLFPAVGQKMAAAAASISRHKGHQST